MTLLPAQRTLLLQRVHAFQVVLLNTRPQLVSSARQFPDQGFDASVLLALELRRQGYRDVAVRTLTDPHAAVPPAQVWLEVEGLHLDWIPTEGSLQPLRLVLGRLVWTGSAAGWRWPWPEQLSDIITTDDAQLQATAQRLNPDHRTSPFRDVEDRWRGIEVLTCGHFAVSNKLLHARRRRCSFCEAALPAKVFRAVTGNREALDWFALLTDEERGTVINDLYRTETEKFTREN